MELNKKFKKTDIGLIPEDWKVAEIGSICNIKVGRDLKLDSFSNVSDSNFKYPIFSNTVSSYGLYGFYNFPEYEGDAVTVVGRGVGLGCAFPRSGGFGAIGRLLVLFPDKSVKNTFLSNYINNRITIFNESGGIPQLTGVSFSKYKVPVPSLIEQEAIANALSDADAYIESLEKLIAKKRLIKKGVMQEIFNLKRLNAELETNWSKKKIIDIANIVKGQMITSKDLRSGDIPVIAGGKTPAYYHDTSNRLSNTITISASGASAGYVSFHTYPIFASDCSTISESKEYDIKYVYYYLTHIQDLIYKAQTGGAQPHIHPKDIGQFLILIPNSIEEQISISKKLSDLDDEILHLGQLLSKMKKVKIGMMQELLTGRIRLV